MTTSFICRLLRSASTLRTAALLLPFVFASALGCGREPSPVIPAPDAPPSVRTSGLDTPQPPSRPESGKGDRPAAVKAPASKGRAAASGEQAVQRTSSPPLAPLPEPKPVAADISAAAMPTSSQPALSPPSAPAPSPSATPSEQQRSSEPSAVRNAPDAVAQPSASPSDPSATTPPPAVPAVPHDVAPVISVDVPAAPAESVPAVELQPAKKAVQGRMSITFGTRTNVDEEGKPQSGSADRYSVALSLLDDLKLEGAIVRTPLLLSSILGREVQSAGLTFDLRFSAGAREIASLTGTVPIDAGGVYSLSGGILALKGSGGRAQPFAGRILGRSQARSRGLTGRIFEYARVIRGKKVSVQSKHVDPLEFSQLKLAAGPLPAFGEATVNGRLDYDYDTGNWLTSNLKFSYLREGARVQDTLSGSIRWIEDANRDANGRGEYQFNIRFNEPEKDESAYFADASDEELFFAVDEHEAALTGSISYVDTFGPEATENGERPVVASKVTYHLESRGLTDQQVMNFVKLWLLIVGPVNDE